MKDGVWGHPCLCLEKGERRSKVVSRKPCLIETKEMERVVDNDHSDISGDCARLQEEAGDMKARGMRGSRIIFAVVPQ